MLQVQKSVFFETIQFRIEMEGQCTVAVWKEASGIDCDGLSFAVRYRATITAATCEQAFQQASATAFSMALMFVANVQDSCN